MNSRYGNLIWSMILQWKMWELFIIGILLYMLLWILRKRSVYDDGILVVSLKGKPQTHSMNEYYYDVNMVLLKAHAHIHPYTWLRMNLNDYDNVVLLIE